MMLAGSTEAAFKNLFAQEYNNLCRYALTYLQDSHQAEDVVQETFIKVWERKQDMIASPDMRFYLITAVRNNCITALRKLRAQNIMYTEDTPEPEPEVHFTAMQYHEKATEQSRQLAAALDLLPPKCREVFLLIKMHGMSYKQAAESLGISVKTIENQMGKAIKLLRENPPAVILILIVYLLMEIFRNPVGVLRHYFVLN